MPPLAVVYCSWWMSDTSTATATDRADSASRTASSTSGLHAPVVVGQWVAKVMGGAIWHEVLRALPIRTRSAGVALDAD